MTVTSSENGFVEGAVVTAHVTDPDGVDATSISYQWSSIDANNVSHAIGTNSPSYTLTAEDVGNKIDVVATYTDLKGHHDTAADPFTVVDPTIPDPTPANSPGVISVSSTDGFNEGATLTATVADTDGVDAAAVIYTWQQQINGVWTDVGTGQTHTIGFNDGNNNFRVLASYTDDAGNPEAPQPVEFTAADVNRPGELTVTSTGNGFDAGATVTAHVTDPDGVDAGSISYQWSSRGADQIWKPVGVDSASYTLTADDIGNEIDVIATYTDNQGHADSAADPFIVTAPETPDPPPPAPPVNSPGVLSVSSTNGFKEGAILTANVTDADGPGTAAVVYTWQEQINNIWTDIGTGQSHTIGFADGGNNFRVLASYTDGAGNLEAPLPVSFIAGDVNQPGTVSVTSSGNGFVEGATLTAKVTDLDGLGAASILYTWQEQNGNTWTDVGTGSTHALGFNDGKNNFRVVASYTDAAGHPEAPVSSIISAIDVNQPGTVSVASSGNGFVEGATLTAKVTDLDGLGAASILYTWQEQSGNTWTDVGTGATHALGFNDGNNNFRVVASYTDAAGHPEAPVSAVIPAIDVNQPGTLSVTSSGNGFVEGATLTAKVTDADGLGAASILYTWQEQSGSTWTTVGTGQTHALGVNDGNNNFRVLANYTDAGGHTEAPAPVAFTAIDVNHPGTLAVTSSGNGFVEGATLTAKVTDLDGLGAASILYTWQEQSGNTWTDVGTGSTHTLGFNDGSNNFRVVASYTDAGGHTEAPVSTIIPAIDVDRAGTLTVTSNGSGFVEGATIQASVTDPDGVNAGAISYQWSSMGSDNLWHPISGATQSSYTLTAADAGKQIDVVATYVDIQGHHDTAADPFSVAASSPSGGSSTGATLLWSQEFNSPLDMKSSSNPDGLWAPVDFWQNINSGGYEDFAGTSWNINPNNPTFAPFNPFLVENGYLQIEAFRTPTELVAPIQQEMKNQGIPGAVPEWSGGILITNKDVVDFTYGYFEFRERIPDGSKGMFPAMWFYSADESADAQGKSTAEIDLYEIFGNQNQWHTNIHGQSSFEAGVQTADTANWHTYGMLWEPDLLQFYEDGKLLYTVSGAQASYFNNMHMAVRVNFSMDAPWFPASAHSDSTTLSSMHMQIDYIRQYSELPFVPT